MRNFTQDYAIHHLSKDVLEFIKELEQPHRDSNSKDIAKHLERLYKRGIFSKQDYLFCSARVILNDYCYMVEEHIGRGIQTGFLFYCQDRDLLCYGAGANYPESMKNYCIRRSPTLDYISDHDFNDDVYTVPDLDNWYENEFKDLLKQEGFRSGTIKRMRMNNFTFGNFSMYFPSIGGASEEEILFIRETLQPIKEQLYKIRPEMLEAVEHAVDNLGELYIP